MKKVLITGIVLFVLGFIFTQTNLFRTLTTNTTQKSSPSLFSKEETSKPSIECTGETTPSQTEGPYYKTGSPERNNIADGIPGEKLVVTGYVFDKNCKPIENAWLDFWQADSNGVYDNKGYTLRGHQYTTSEGKFRLETIVPSDYESRPPHIHVKVRTESGLILTSQIYFEGESKNQTDPIFNQVLVMNARETQEGKVGEFNFVLNQ